MPHLGLGRGIALHALELEHHVARLGISPSPYRCENHQNKAKKDSNGTIGADALSHPLNERVIFTHERLFLPMCPQIMPLDQAARLFTDMPSVDLLATAHTDGERVPVAAFPVRLPMGGRELDHLNGVTAGRRIFTRPSGHQFCWFQHTDNGDSCSAGLSPGVLLLD